MGFELVFCTTVFFLSRRNTLEDLRMQKLVTVYLCDLGETGDRELKEHLNEYLSDGWTIKSIIPAGTGTGAGGDSRDYGYIAGWLVVLLEK
jgi:hypothetical protein